MTNQTILQAARTVQADTKLARKALKNADWAEISTEEKAQALRVELCENVYPLLESVSRIGQKLAEGIEELNGVVSELVEDEESFITPELSDQIGFALGAGQAIAAELLKILPSVTDELLKKRLEDGVKSYQRAAEIAWEGIANAAGDEDDDEDDEEEDKDGNHEDLLPPAAADSSEGETNV